LKVIVFWVVWIGKNDYLNGWVIYGDFSARDYAHLFLPCLYV
jgi:hypothetical protein